MKVRMLESIAGHAMPHYGIDKTFSLAPGDQLELHDDLAAKWIGSKIAEPLRVQAGTVGDLAKHTKAELIAFGSAQLGLDLDASMRKEQILSAIQKKLADRLDQAIGGADADDDAEDENVESPHDAETSEADHPGEAEDVEIPNAGTERPAETAGE